MTATAPLFSTDFGTILDFSSKRPADIFNGSVVPRVNSLLQMVESDLEPRQPEGLRDELFTEPETDEFSMPMRRLDSKDASSDISDYDNPN
jgi:hypothetical protein